MRLIALDPGVTTGWALFQAPPHHRDASLPLQAYFRGFGELQTTCACACETCTDNPIHHCSKNGCKPEDYHLALYKWLYRNMGQASDCTIIYEDFRNRAVAGARLDSVEYIGVLKLFAQVTSVSLVSQGADIKIWASPAKLKRSQIAAPTSFMHARDAQRHLLYYLAQNEQVPEDLRFATLRLIREPRK